MSTISISKKEYDALVFAKTNRKDASINRSVFNDSAFGVFEKAKTSSVILVNKLRKSWR